MDGNGKKKKTGKNDGTLLSFELKSRMDRITEHVEGSLHKQLGRDGVVEKGAGCSINSHSDIQLPGA